MYASMFLCIDFSGKSRKPGWKNAGEGLVCGGGQSEGKARARWYHHHHIVTSHHHNTKERERARLPSGPSRDKHGTKKASKLL
jgi:hypothetical protein